MGEKGGGRERDITGGPRRCGPEREGEGGRTQKNGAPKGGATRRVVLGRAVLGRAASPGPLATPPPSIFAIVIGK